MVFVKFLLAYELIINGSSKNLSDLDHISLWVKFYFLCFIVI